MALTGLLAGFNEQRGSNTNYLAQLDAMRRAQTAADLDQQRLTQQADQASQEMMFRQDQAAQAAQARDSQSLHQTLRDQQQRMGQMGQESFQLAQQQRQAQARNALKDLLSNGEDVSTAELGRTILPYDPSTGISLIKASKEEQRQQSLLDRTGGTGVSAPQNYRWTKDGNLEAIPGGAADPTVLAQMEGIKSAYKVKEQKPLTEAQANAAGYGMRAAQSALQLEDLANQGVKTGGLIKQGAEAVPLVGGALGAAVNTLPGYLGGPSGEQQRVEQAQRNFVNAVLRRESGAAISPVEFESAKKQYFPQPGDLPETVAQKQQNMATTIDALRLGAGQGAENIPAYKPGQSQPTTNWQDHYQSKAQAISDALEAVRKGAPRDAVAKRLKEIGIEDARI